MISRPGGVFAMPQPSPSGSAAAGARPTTLDRLGAALRERQDALVARAAPPRAAYPQPAVRAPGTGAEATAAGAFAAYLQTPHGRESLERVASAAAGGFARLFGGAASPEQLRLPLEV